MTTVAFKDGVLASDSRATRGDVIHQGDVQKIHTPREGEYWDVEGIRVLAFGLAGGYRDVAVVREVLAAGLTHRWCPDQNLDMDTHALIIDENQQAWEFLCVKTPRMEKAHVELIMMGNNVAAGSGEIIAKAVMAVGKDAKTAVKITMKLDPYTGGELQVFQCPPVPSVPSKRPQPIEAPKEEKALEPVKA